MMVAQCGIMSTQLLPDEMCTNGCSKLEQKAVGSCYEKNMTARF